MPCRDDYPTETSCAAEARVRKELEPLLCEACTTLENYNIMITASTELRQWYKIHDQREEHRVRLETAMKLSEKDRRVLGIDLAALQRAADNAKCK